LNFTGRVRLVREFYMTGTVELAQIVEHKPSSNSFNN